MYFVTKNEEIYHMVFIICAKTSFKECEYDEIDNYFFIMHSDENISHINVVISKKLSINYTIP